MDPLRAACAEVPSGELRLELPSSYLSSSGVEVTRSKAVPAVQILFVAKFALTQFLRGLSVQIVVSRRRLLHARQLLRHTLLEL